MVALKGKPDIGDQINKKIIASLADPNKLADMPGFNEATKLGSGKEMVDRLTNLIAIFENPALDFSKNRADGGEILGDAYECLMRHFATESGKSKGQFYTPAEVSHQLLDRMRVVRSSQCERLILEFAELTDRLYQLAKRELPILHDPAFEIDRTGKTSAGNRRGFFDQGQSTPGSSRSNL